MEKIVLHTPEGVRDIYGNEYAGKLKIEDTVHHQFHLYGYEDIQTPTFEYFDVFSKEIGTTPSKDLYKFFDKEGNTLVLRPDFTPSMARCAAKYYMDEKKPFRFCYEGNTFTNTNNLQGKLKELTQMGVELINDDSVYADAEIISLTVESLRSTGLQNFQISIGEVDYFKGICEDAGINAETEAKLRDYISGKNLFAAEELLIEQNVSPEKRNAILKITDYFGGYEILDEADTEILNSRARNAIKRLRKLYKVLNIYGVDRYVSFDLGMLSKYHYYTGVIFKAYAYGVGDAVVKGGRYDKLLGYFGKQSPAIGFVIVIDDLLLALERQEGTYQEKAEIMKIYYTQKNYVSKLEEAKKFRAMGTSVALVPDRE